MPKRLEKKSTVWHTGWYTYRKISNYWSPNSVKNRCIVEHLKKTPWQHLEYGRN